MKIRIYTYSKGNRVLHTAYMSKEADEKYDTLVASGEYDKVEMWFGPGYRPLRTWNK